MTDSEKDKAIIKAFVASGLVLREWGGDVYFSRIVPCDGRLRREWRHGSCDPWQHDVDADDRDIVNEILRQLPEICDEAGVFAWKDGPEATSYIVTQGGRSLCTDGRFRGILGAGMSEAEFATRPEALLAAVVAIQKGK